jgi:hypothetical protein
MSWKRYLDKKQKDSGKVMSELELLKILGTKFDQYKEAFESNKELFKDVEAKNKKLEERIAELESVPVNEVVSEVSEAKTGLVEVVDKLKSDLAFVRAQREKMRQEKMSAPVRKVVSQDIALLEKMAKDLAKWRNRALKCAIISFDEQKKSNEERKSLKKRAVVQSLRAEGLKRKAEGIRESLIECGKERAQNETVYQDYMEQSRRKKIQFREKARSLENELVELQARCPHHAAAAKLAAEEDEAHPLAVGVVIPKKKKIKPPAEEKIELEEDIPLERLVKPAKDGTRRGRPKGAKNRPKPSPFEEPKEKRKRGRPKGSKNKN